MLDFLRDLTKSAEEKRQEQLTAYVDGELSPRERGRFEQMLAEDSTLQAEVAQYRQFKQQLHHLPRRRVPRNFTLDPAVYGTPARQPLLQLYPVMRAATVITAVFLVIAVTADLLTLSGVGSDMAAPAAAPVAMQSDTAEEAASEPVAENAIVEEEAVAESEAQTTIESFAAEAPAAEVGVAEEPVVEEMAEEPAEIEVTEEMTEMPEAETALVEPGAAVKITPIAIGPEAETATDAGTQNDDGEDTAANDMTTAAEVQPADSPPTPSPAATPTPDTPRVQPTETITDRAELSQEAATEVASAPEPTAAVVQEQGETAVSPPPPPTSPISTLRFIQIGLAVLLVLLGTAVWFTRRQL